LVHPEPARLLRRLPKGSYDNNGNTLTKVDSTGTTTYSWDYENRLTSVSLPRTGGTVSFKYDPFGRRIYKSSSSSTSIYSYDGENLIEETNSSGAAVARYALSGSIDDSLAMLRSSTTSYYEQDGLGTVSSLSNDAGALAQTYTFAAFGNQTTGSSSLANSFRYTGREFEHRNQSLLLPSSILRSALRENRPREKLRRQVFNRTLLFAIASVLSYAESVDVSMPDGTKTRVSSSASGFRTRFLEE
jgi:YD repeat-containing protein